MSEKCEMCGSDVLPFTHATYRDKRKSCYGDCPFNRGSGIPAEQFDRIQTALALLRRIESGESVEIKQLNGKWPETTEHQNGNWFFRWYSGSSKRCFVYNTFPEAAAAWNKGAE